MRNCFVRLILGMAVLAFSPVVLAQSTGQPGTVETPDLSGVWDTNERSAVFIRNPIPMTPWAAEQFEYNRNPGSPYRRGRNELDPYISKCMPAALPRVWLIPRPFEIIQSEERVLIIYESDSWIRRIYTDGREHPRVVDPAWMGHSIGKWDGDTLVIDTVGIRANNHWLDGAGHVRSADLHLVERLTRTDPMTLTMEITFEDPKAFTRPWTARKTFELLPGLELTEDLACEDKLLGIPFSVE